MIAIHQSCESHMILIILFSESQFFTCSIKIKNKTTLHKVVMVINKGNLSKVSRAPSTIKSEFKGKTTIQMHSY